MACKYKSRVWDNGWCNVACSYCTLTQESTCKHNKQTNADRIRAMSDEELANFVASKIVNIENQKMLEQGHISTATQLRALGATMHDILIMWLKQPAEEEKTVTEGHR